MYYKQGDGDGDGDGDGGGGHTSTSTQSIDNALYHEKEGCKVESLLVGSPSSTHAKSKSE